LQTQLGEIQLERGIVMDAPELIKFRCACGAKIGAKPEIAGKRVRCPKCGASALVPTPMLAVARVHPPAEAAIEPVRLRVPAAKPAALNCANCDVPIGRLQTPQIWRDQAVCPDCYSKLSVPPTASASSGPAINIVNTNIVGRPRMGIMRPLQALSALGAVAGGGIWAGALAMGRGEGAEALGMILLVGGIIGFIIFRIMDWIVR
jgi:DNA-directed RNA polymerase subunit RPC12/RpoP